MDLVNRLKFFMESNDIAISQFADTCRIPRPTMSQILNGRNKKVSDELISKIHSAFPELSVLWLMFGEGEMTANPNTLPSSDQKPYATEAKCELYSDTQTITAHAADIDNSMDSASEKYYSNSPQPFPQQANNSEPQIGNISSEYTDSLDASSSEQAVIDFEHTTEYKIPSDNKAAKSNPTYTANQTSFIQQNDILTTSSEQQMNIENAAHVSPTTDKQKTSTAHTPSEADAKPETCNISLQTPPNKRITKIVVFYSDNSFQSFNPAALY